MQRPPGGGPEDTTPPRVVQTIPAHDSTGVAPATGISCRFSESVNRLSVIRALSIAPPFPEIPEYEWDGDRLSIIPPEPLRPNRTYVITIGTDAVDQRNNRLPHSFSWAFSTGDRIDRGRLSGRVYGGEDIGGCWVDAYAIDAAHPAPDPGRDEPDYRVQTDADGQFILDYIADGNYRIFAYQDMNRDLRFSLRFDPLAVPPGDVAFAQNRADRTELLLSLALRDTLPPAARGTQHVGPRGVSIRFDKPLNPRQDAHRMHLRLMNAAQQPVDMTEWDRVLLPELPDELLLYPGTPLPENTYTLYVSGAENSLGFASAGIEDTVQFRISGEPPKEPARISERTPTPQSAVILPSALLTCTFDQPLQATEANTAISVTDTLGRPVVIAARWVSATMLEAQPVEWWTAGAGYQVRVHVDRLQDHFGRAPADTLSEWTFTVSGNESGQLAGTVHCEGEPAAVRVWLLDHKTGLPADSVSLAQPGAFRFPRVFAGSYALMAFLDTDGDGRLSHGSLSPYHPAEPFVMTADPLEVRSGWDNEGIELTIEP